MSLTGKQWKVIWFVVGVMAIDTLITSYGIYYGLGKEINPMFAWIQESHVHLIAAIVAAKTVAVIAMVCFMYLVRINDEHKNSEAWTNISCIVPLLVMAAYPVALIVVNVAYPLI